MKTINWIQLGLLVSLILLGVFAAIYDNSKLTECNLNGKAVIVDKSKRKSRGYFIKYQYEIEGNTYTSSESLDKEEELIFKMGDTIDIAISCGDFNVSRYKK